MPSMHFNFHTKAVLSKLYLKNLVIFRYNAQFFFNLFIIIDFSFYITIFQGNLNFISRNISRKPQWVFLHILNLILLSINTLFINIFINLI